MDAFNELARESTTMLLPSKISDPAAMVAQVCFTSFLCLQSIECTDVSDLSKAMSIYTGISEKSTAAGGGVGKPVKFPLDK